MKNILVTGASSGIGEAVSRYLSECGYRVIMVARREEQLLEIAKDMDNKPLLIPFDLTKFDEYETIFSGCRKEGMKLDGFVHCAGMGTSMPVKGIRIKEDIQAQMEINAYSFAELGRYFSSKRFSNDGGTVVAVSSMASQSCAIGHCGYAASKAALNAMVKVMAREFVRRKIRVNAIMPTYVDTPLLQGDLEDAFDLKATIEKTQALGIIEPKSIAYLVEFLISEKAKYITGALVPVTAGLL